MTREVRGRSDDEEPHLGRDRDGHHILIDHLAQAHAGIVSLRHDVGRRVVRDQIEVYLRVLPQESPPSVSLPRKLSPEGVM
jgi:hypothetical protein